MWQLTKKSPTWTTKWNEPETKLEYFGLKSSYIVSLYFLKLLLVSSYELQMNDVKWNIFSAKKISKLAQVYLYILIPYIHSAWTLHQLQARIGFIPSRRYVCVHQLFVDRRIAPNQLLQLITAAAHNYDLKSWFFLWMNEWTNDILQFSHTCVTSSKIIPKPLPTQAMNGLFDCLKQSGSVYSTQTHIKKK